VIHTRAGLTRRTHALVDVGLAKQS
jgi:hypothetical protein